MKNLVISFLLILPGCCTNYSLYARSMDKDLEVLSETYEEYVNEDERLSEADRRARLSILVEMKEKTNIAIRDSE